jgi:hypothetical protein
LNSLYFYTSIGGASGATDLLPANEFVRVIVFFLGLELASLQIFPDDPG